MAFRFALTPLLRLRKSLERQRALELQRASLNLARAEDTLAELERFLEESAYSDSRSLAAGRVAAELHFASVLREQLERSRVQLQDGIRALDRVRRQAAIAYQHALNAREALETLRDQQRRIYEREQARREQQEVDTAYLVQRWYRQKG
ncbi:MAG TPA: flagellar FliJ family protein [Terriglobales bacterium]|nr:flagellar FliJ family protein [Terriglobales bacterium]